LRNFFAWVSEEFRSVEFSAGFGAKVAVRQHIEWLHGKGRD
jgi:hypothetical protein